MLSDHPGELLSVPERMVVSPTAGVFEPGHLLDVEGGTFEAGAQLGVVVGPGTRTPVRSPFAGTLHGVLARSGERLRAGQPVAWLRVR